LNALYLVALCLALIVIQCLVGGSRLLFSLPAYGILALAAVVSLRDLRRPKLPPDGVCLGASALFFGWIIIRALISPVAYLAWADLFMVLGALIVYLLTACYFTDPRRRMWVVTVLLLLAAVNLAVAARQFKDGDAFMLFGFIRSPEYGFRSSGMYICPDHLAGFLEVAGSLAVALGLWSRCGSIVKGLLLYGGFCCFAGILLTGSRGGFLSAGCAIFVLTALSLARMKVFAPGFFWKAMLLTLALACVGGAGLYRVVMSHALLKSRAEALVTPDVRPRLWQAALKQFALEPVRGTGSSTYLYYGRRFRDPSIQNDPIRVHNDYLQLLAEYGLIGAAGLLVFLGAHLRRGWKAFRALSLRAGNPSARISSNAAAWNMGALAALASYLAHSVVDFNLHIPANALLVAFVFGVLANPGRSLSGDESTAPRVRGVDLCARLALPVLGVWVMAMGLPKLPGEYYSEKARVALRDGKAVQALNFARAGLERESKNPNLYYYMGEARQKLADQIPNPVLAQSFRKAAIEPYEQGLTLFPEDTRLLLRLGYALTMTGEFDKGEDIFARALRADPNSAQVQTYYGYYLHHRGMLREAEAAYQRAQALLPNKNAHAGLESINEARAAGVLLD
jgi:O-antigen ligase